VDRVAGVIGDIRQHISGRAILGIYLVILLYEWADGVGFDGAIGGDKLGDDIDAIVVALTR